MTPKYTSEDRKKVIEELEKVHKSKLFQVKPSRKLYKDEKDMYFLLFGGKDNWHGINKNLMEKISSYNKEGAFVVAKKYKTRIDVCVGSLKMLIENKEKLIITQKGDSQFHTFLTEDGMFVDEIKELHLNKVSEIYLPGHKRNFDKLKEISKIINIEIEDDVELTHSDIQAKLILIGSYLDFRTYTPDKSKQSIYGVLGDLSSEKEIPKDYIPPKQVDTIKYIDVIWFDDEGFPTHAFEVEHSTDVTKGLLRLYQVHKLKIKMYIIADEKQKGKYERELSKNPFHKIKEGYIFKNYQELD